MRALSKAYESLSNEPVPIGSIALGALKANIGHLDAAAGVAGFIKTLMVLKDKQLPPLINFSAPNPELNIDATPFYVNQQLSDWKVADYPRRAAVSSFGIGGTNAHVVLEEAPQSQSHSSHFDYHLLVVSARSVNALQQAVDNLYQHLHATPQINLPDVAHTLQQGRQRFEYSHYVVCDSVQSALDKLQMPFKPMSFAADKRAPAVVFMFPGQGGQYVGMMQNLYQGSGFFRQQLDTCIELFNAHLQNDLKAVIFSQPQADEASLLYQTQYTQPALFCVEYALAKYWQRVGNPRFSSEMASHVLSSFRCE